MKKIITALTAFIILSFAYSPSENRLETAKLKIYNHYLFTETAENSQTATIIKEGTSFTIEITLSEGIAYILAAASEDPKDEISINITDAQGKNVKILSKEEITEYTKGYIDAEAPLPQATGFDSVWTIPESTEVYKVNIALEKSAQGTTSEIAFVMLYENVNIW